MKISEAKYDNERLPIEKNKCPALLLQYELQRYKFLLTTASPVTFVSLDRKIVH